MTLKKFLFRSIEPALIILFLLGVSGAANLIVGFNLISFTLAALLGFLLLIMWVVAGSKTCMAEPQIKKIIEDCGEKMKSAATWTWGNTLDVVCTAIYCYFGWWFAFLLSVGVIALTKIPAYLLVETLKDNEAPADSTDTIA